MSSPANPDRALLLHLLRQITENCAQRASGMKHVLSSAELASVSIASSLLMVLPINVHVSLRQSRE
jgi:hypothetical protein